MPKTRRKTYRNRRETQELIQKPQSLLKSYSNNRSQNVLRKNFRKSKISRREVIEESLDFRKFCLEAFESDYLSEILVRIEVFR